MAATYSVRLCFLLSVYLDGKRLVGIRHMLWLRICWVQVENWTVISYNSV